MKKKTVIISGDNQLFVDALRTILGTLEEFSVTACAVSGVDTIKTACDLKPDVIIADQEMPDINLLVLVREIAAGVKKARFLLLIKEETEELLTVISETETIGILHYKSGVNEFIKALRLVAKGDNYISPNTISRLRAVTPGNKKSSGDMLSEITHRERYVLYWLARGRSNKEIAEMLILSEKTVKNHVSHILKKLKITDRTKAAAIAWEDGLPMMSEEFFL